MTWQARKPGRMQLKEVKGGGLQDRLGCCWVSELTRSLSTNWGLTLG